MKTLIVALALVITSPALAHTQNSCQLRSRCGNRTIIVLPTNSATPARRRYGHIRGEHHVEAASTIAALFA